MATVTFKPGSSDDLLVFSLRGRVTLESLVAALERSLECGPVDLVLWNAVDGDLSGFSLADLGTLVSGVLTGAWAPRRWAILADRGPTLAAAALIEAFAEERGAGGRVMAFRDREAALEWLGIQERPTTPSPRCYNLLSH